MPRPISLSKHNPLILLYGVFVILFCAAIALIFLPSPAKAVPVPCVTAEILREQAKHRFPHLAPIYMKDKLAADFLKVYNSIPPVSDLAGSQVLALHHGRRVQTIVIRNGCASYKVFIRSDLFLKILQFIASKKPKDTHA